MTTETSKLKLEVGKVYRTRDGRKARVICTDRKSESGLSVVAMVPTAICDEIKTFFPNGRYSNIENSHDLLTEWHDEPQVDWAAMPKWVRFACLDSTQNAYGYPERPDLGELVWIPTSGNKYWCRIPPQYFTYTGDWKLSLVERPSNL